MLTSNKKNVIIAIIEKGDDGGYSIYAKDIPGSYGYGLTEKEAKKEFVEIVKEQLEYMNEKVDEFRNYDIQNIEYRYDFSGFFKSFPYFNATELAKFLGINSSLLRKYKSGIAYPSEKQKEKIQGYFDDMIEKLHSVKF